MCADLRDCRFEYLDFPDPDWEAVRRVMEVDFFGTVNCMAFVLPLLHGSQRQRPQLVIMASQVTATPFPRAEAYGASKAALQYFCASLRLDLAPEKIDVSVVSGFNQGKSSQRQLWPLSAVLFLLRQFRRIYGEAIKCE